MGTVSYDFTTEAVEAPISIGGDWQTLFGTSTQAPQLKNNSGNVNAAPNNTSAPACSGLVIGAGSKQYSEIVIGLNWLIFNSISPAVFCSAGGNAYYVNLDRPYSISVNNELRKVVGNTVTSLSSVNLGGVLLAAGDKVGVQADESAGSTTITLFHNPTAYDVDGFPTNGSIGSVVDTDLTSGSLGLVGYRGNGTEAYATDFYAAGTVTVPPAPTNPGNERIITAVDVDTGPYSVGQFLTSPNPVDGDYDAPPSTTAAGGVVTATTTNSHPDLLFTIDYTGLGFVPANDSMLWDYYDSVGASWSTIDITLVDGEISQGGVAGSIISSIVSPFVTTVLG